MNGSDSSARRALFILGGLLSVCALVSGLRLDDDSYQHFGRSVHQLGTCDFAALLTDVWNKPVPALLYGVPGLLGIDAARLVSVALVVVTAWLTLQLCLQLVPEALRGARWTYVVLFATQLAVLKDAFVTMTELPAAACLALSLWLQLVKRRPWLAALAAGMTVLCRVELVPVVAFMGCMFSVDAFLQSAAPRRLGVRVVLPVGLALLPFALWLLAGAFIKHDALWFGRESYAHLRRWGLPGLLRYNVLSGLPAVATPPALVALVVGCVQAPRLIDPSVPKRVPAMLFGVLGIHYLLLNTLEVFPEGWEGVPSGHAVAAINARNYTPTAPVATLFMALGVAAWVRARSTREPRFLRVLGTAGSVVCLAIVAGQWNAHDMLVLELALLALSLAVAAFALRGWHAGAATRPWCWVAAAALAAALLIRPFFWYPTRWNDRRSEAVAALAQLVGEQRPALVVQDIASSLEVFGRLRGVDATWSWAMHFPAQLSAANAGTLVVVEVDATGQLLGRYPATLRAELASRCDELERFDSEPTAPWLRAVDRLASRNQPLHWVAYRVR